MNALIPRQINGEVICQRQADGYVHATALCKAAGKLWADYRRQKSSAEFEAELSGSMGIPIDLLTQTIMVGPNEQRGTWVHPRIAIRLAQWLSVRFEVLVSQWVYDWVSQGRPGEKPKAELPYHLRRYVANYHNVPHGHFSVLSEMTIALVAPLEMLGYTLPERLWPDISEGRMFSSWLRNEHGIEPKDLPTYRHEFEDGRRATNARAYPFRLLGHFREHMNDVWIPQRSISYFKERDPAALEFLPKLLAPTASAVASIPCMTC